MRLFQHLLQALMDCWSWAEADQRSSSGILYLAIWVILFFFLNLTGGLTDTGELGGESGFLSKTVVVDGRQRPYWVYVPPTYDPDQEWPLIVFLAGLIQWGNPSVLPIGAGIGPALLQNPDLYQCIVAIPQVPFPATWWGNDDLIEAVIEDTRQRYSIDGDRVILTGLSSGGNATLQFGADHVDLFAALVPIGTEGNTDEAETLAQLPIWVFHGSLDTMNAPSKVQAMVDAIRAAGGNVLYTEYPDLTHFNTWDRAYNDPEVIEWMLSQSRAKRETNNVNAP